MIRVLAVIFCISPAAVFAQAAGITLGGGAFDANAPVDVTSDSLSLDQASGTATFDGNVLVVQGDVRMAASRIEVEYGDAGVSLLKATGGVTFVTPTEAAEADAATYVVADGDAVLTGNVTLKQGQATISGDRLVFDLDSGTGRMEGSVRTTLGGAN